jgi:site-specific DNA-methyltransferase (adenine-specific)
MTIVEPTIFDNKIRLYQGDALTVLRELPADSVDAVLTDPPYSSGGTSSAARKADPADKYQSSGTKRSYPAMLGDNKDQRSCLAWAALWLAECWRIAKDGSPLLLFSDWRQLPLMTDAVQAGGWTWRGVVVWEKPSARPMRGQFRAQAEYVVFATKGRFARTTDRCLPGVFRHSVEMARRVHLTAKPVPLLRELLEVAKPGGLVLDPFMGGGATGLASLETGRSFVGVELSPEYYKIASARINEKSRPRA